MRAKVFFLVFLLITICFHISVNPIYAEAKQSNKEIYFSVTEGIPLGGQPSLAVFRSSPKGSSPLVPYSFLGFDVLPGLGMNVWQVWYHHPIRGKTSLFVSSLIEDLQKKLADDVQSNRDLFLNRSFFEGAALLFPWANRLRGAYTEQKGTLRAPWRSQVFNLPANWPPPAALAAEKKSEPSAIHGLLYAQAFAVSEKKSGSEAWASAKWQGSGLNVGWPSSLEVKVTAQVSASVFRYVVEATNVGKEDTPVSIGWHPYFAIASGKRSQVLLNIPARSRLEVDGPVQLFPTGKRLANAGSSYDFLKGKKLADQFLDDTFVDLLPLKSGWLEAQVTDPEAAVTLTMGARAWGPTPKDPSPLKALQVYAPVDRPFVCIEPQYNVGDPLGHIWKTPLAGELQEGGMVVLAPGQRTRYEVYLRLSAKP